MKKILTSIIVLALLFTAMPVDAGVAGNATVQVNKSAWTRLSQAINSLINSPSVGGGSGGGIMPQNQEAIGNLAIEQTNWNNNCQATHGYWYFGYTPKTCN